MANIQISDDLLRDIKDKVVIITGGASGIGKATAELCLQHGATVIVGCRNTPSDLETSDKLKFVQMDVDSWDSQREAFHQVEEWYGRVDHVFANAGVGPITDFLDNNLDANGHLTPPDLRTINTNLLGVISTVRLAAYYIQKHSAHRKDGELGSIVITASASSFQNFSAGDYTITKHGVLGLLRGMENQLEGKVRLNAVAPSWTATGMVPSEFIESLGVGVQTPEAVARSVVLLFNDTQRHGEVIYSWDGKYLEVNKAEGGLLASAERMLGDSANDHTVLRKLQEA